jgi:hypothetical protein
MSLRGVLDLIRSSLPLTGRLLRRLKQERGSQRHIEILFAFISGCCLDLACHDKERLHLKFLVLRAIAVGIIKVIYIYNLFG